MKKISKVLLIVSAMTFLLFTGCDLAVGMKSSNVNGKYNASFTKLEGNQDDSLDAKSDVMRISAEMEKGTVSIQITDDDNNIVFEEKDVKGIDKQIDVKKGNSYNIIITGDNAKGKYSFDTSDK